MVPQIKSLEEFREKLANAENKLVVVKFYATWCKDSQKISSKFEEFSAQFADVIFYQVDVDVGRTIAIAYKLNKIPAIIFFKNGEQVAALADSVDKLKDLLEKYN